MTEPQDSPQRQGLPAWCSDAGRKVMPLFQGAMHACMHASLQEAEVASNVMAGAVDLQLTMEHLSEEAQEALYALAALPPPSRWWTTSAQAT